MATCGGGAHPRTFLAFWPPWLLLLLAFLVISPSPFVSSSPTTRIPRLGVFRGSNINYARHGHNDHLTQNKNKVDNNINAILAEEGFETFYYNQTLDHFNYAPGSYATFRHKYIINFKHWRGAHASAPIFVYFGDEAPLAPEVRHIGLFNDHAPRFGALLVYIEHRFYGESIPSASTQEEALRNATLRGYFSSAQALADYAEVLLHIKKKLSAEKSPVIVVGGSYGGMLAAWFRLKYPHIALGALASSAPVLYFDNITSSDGYFSVVTKDFREASENCYKIIKQSWSEIDRVAAEPHGLSILRKKFNFCKPLSTVSDLKDYLGGVYAGASQYDTPPGYPVQKVCKAISGAPEGSHILDKIISGMLAYEGNKTCYGRELYFPTETERGWDWQSCSEMVIPIGRSGHGDDMFPAMPFNVKEYNYYCKKTYGISPRPHWITTHYGGHHIKEVLKRFGSNIIFSNGLRDPYSSGGVLEDISDSILAVKTTKGSHCLDIMPSSKHDPEWLVSQRNREVEIVSEWILNYYQDLFENL